MRVLLLASPRFEEIGGVATHVYMLREGLKRLGHHVVVVPASPPRIYRAPMVTLPSIILRHRSQYAAHRWSYWMNHAYYFMDALLRSGFRPDVLNIQNVWHAPLARKLKILTGCRTVLTVHGFLTFEAEQGGRCIPNDRLWKWLWSLETTGYDSVDAVVAVSARMAQYVQQFSHAPVAVIHNGIDTEQFRPSPGFSEVLELSDLNSPNGAAELRLLFAGLLEPHKGLLDAVVVLASLRKAGVAARLLVAGKGSEEEPARGLARELGVALHIEWRGPVPKSQMPAFYNSGDVMLMPSKPRGSGEGEEPFGYTSLEAMACGVPVVAYRTGGLAEQIVDGLNGYLVAPGDWEGMVVAVRKLSDPALRSELGTNARRYVEKHFSCVSMAKQFVQVYEHGVRGMNNVHPQDLRVACTKGESSR